MRPTEPEAVESDAFAAVERRRRAARERPMMPAHKENGLQIIENDRLEDSKVGSPTTAFA